MKEILKSFTQITLIVYIFVFTGYIIYLKMYQLPRKIILLWSVKMANIIYFSFLFLSFSHAQIFLNYFLLVKNSKHFFNDCREECTEYPFIFNKGILCAYVWKYIKYFPLYFILNFCLQNIFFHLHAFFFPTNFR